ncbi:hypothetical protein EsDP_00001487 [Epichloe bromicola]|uniref:Tyrosine specific protein phosphatases domain-containing protein n=1 Tax=Epichloe bromicola TaxID=79588 RepID=A0ABQ0CI07_9HYPO
MASPSTGSREHWHPLSISGDAVRSADYSYRAPSPPYIHIPGPKRTTTKVLMELMPSYEHVDPSQLTSDDLQIITQNAKQVAIDQLATWAYEDRRFAQAIVDFLFLGPTSIIRDHHFLKREGITMMLVVRDPRLTGTLRSVDQASEELGIAVEYVHVDGPADLIRGFPNMIRLINDHLLSVYHSQSRGRNDEGQILMETCHFRRGKVLVTCDSGNHRSAAIVAAYLMSVFGQSMVSTVQFVQLKRFCCIYDEDMKRMLQSWEDILRARSMVAHHSQSESKGQQQSRVCSQDTDAQPVRHQPTRLAASKSKRGFDNMMELVMGAEKGAFVDTDEDRFLDRDPFFPFADVPKNG